MQIKQFALSTVLTWRCFKTVKFDFDLSSLRLVIQISLETNKMDLY